jgi:ABC-type transport system substrate-binding protein
MDLFLRIKKYLFLLAFVISITLSIHVIVVYLYDDAEMVADRGGTFSIGATGLSPSLNPTQYGQDTLNDFMLKFLYRGLLRYNPETKTMEGDLANCDISKNLGEIRCFFKTGAVWSDGSKITIEDALATYSLLAETETNKKLQSSLSKFAITREETALVFRSTNGSIETLQLLTIPVIKKSITEQLRNGGKIQEEVYG